MKNPSSKLVRMKLDLQEYDFDIEYIRGKNNVASDALSRLHIQDLIQTEECTRKQITYVTTRSMAKQQHDNNPNEKVASSSEKVNDIVSITEVLDNSEAYGLYRLKFIIKSRQPRLEIVDRKKKRAVLCIRLTDNFIKDIQALEHDMSRRKWADEAEISILYEYFVREKLALGRIISRLDKEAGKMNINKVAMELNSQIFSYLPVTCFKQIANENLKNLNILLTKPILHVTDNEQKRSLIEKFHKNPTLGGHCGRKRLLAKLRTYYFWKHMHKDVARFLKTCHDCQLNKPSTKTLQPMCLTNSPIKAFDIVTIDTVGPFLRTPKANTYLITIECELTKYLVAIPIQNKEAKTIARAIFEDFILIYGPMKEIRTDMGTEYLNQTFSEITSLLNITHKTSTPYRPQTIGTVERSHRVLNEYLRMYTNDCKTDWDDWVPYFTYCYNTTPSTVHHYCPFELIFAKTPTLPNDFTNAQKISPIYNIDDYAKEAKFRLQSSLSRARQYLEKSKIERKSKYDQSKKEINVRVGDLVLISNEARTKLDPMYKGPFRVKSCDNFNCVLTDGNKKTHTVHKNRIIRYHQ